MYNCLVTKRGNYMEKQCFKCKTVKPFSDFYKHPRMADGHLNKCKECTKNDVGTHRGKNLEKIREYDRERGARQTPEYRKYYISTYPRKYVAKNMVNNAVRDGKLDKPSNCETCSKQSKRLHGHHDDYAKPLEVRWLCAACHSQWHAKHGESPNGGW